MVMAKGMSDVVTFSLPVDPFSLNNAFTNVRGVGRVKSKAYKAWCRAVDQYLQLTGRRTICGSDKGPRLTGRVDVRIWVRRPDERRRDIDNLIKPILDACVRNRVIGDDSDVDCVMIRWEEMPQPILVAIAQVPAL